MSERLNLIVADGVAERMTILAQGERRRGLWLSRLVNAMHDQEQIAQGSGLEQLHYAFAGVSGGLKLLEGRIAQLERTVAELRAAEAGRAE